MPTREFLLPKGAALRTVPLGINQGRWQPYMGFRAFFFSYSGPFGERYFKGVPLQRVCFEIIAISVALLTVGVTLSAVSRAQSNPERAEKVNCGAITARTLVELKDASAGLFANLRGAESSIKYQSGAILKRALEIQKEQKPPQLLCPQTCAPPSASSIEFVARPRKFNKEHSENEKCEGYFTQTTAQPLTWLHAPFGDFDEFAKRFSDFSQGSGPAGEELYRKCDGACSPQYRILISHVTSQSGYFADVYVVCGSPRDKSDNMYSLETSLVWSCGAVTKKADE